MQKLHFLLEELHWMLKNLGFTQHAGFRAHCDFPHGFLQPATLLQPHQLRHSLCTWAHLTCWTMPGSTTPFPDCIILLGGPKTLSLKFSPSQPVQEHHLHKVAFLGSFSLFTQPALFPQVICLQKKKQQKKVLSSDPSTL